MAQQKKPDTTIGNGRTKTPILASEKDPTAAQSEQSRRRTSIESGSTKPLSLREALSLLQTIYFDLQSMGCKVSILARDKPNNRRFYVVCDLPPDTGTLTFERGHFTIDGKPVSEE